MVLAVHCLHLPGNSAVVQFLRRLVGAGWTGVDLFFVLSGFLITGILLDTKGQLRYFRNFYVRRSLRIFPLYFATLTLFLIALPIGAQYFAPGSRTTDRLLSLQRDQWWYWTYLQNWLFVIRNDLPDPKHLGHLWSLAVEEQFYVVWPWLVGLLSRRRLASIAAGTLLLCPLLRWIWMTQGFSWFAIYVATLTRVDSFCMGALVALAVRHLPTRSWLQLHRRELALGTLAGVLSLVVLDTWRPLLNMYDLPSQWYRYTLIGAVSTCLVATAVVADRESTPHRILTLPWLLWMGRYSYGIYVIHWPVRYVLERTMFAPSPWQELIQFALSVSVTLVLARISMWGLEQPFLRMKRHFAGEPAVSGPGQQAKQPADQSLPAAQSVAIREGGPAVIHPK